jgi:SET domain-containing protein
LYKRISTIVHLNHNENTPETVGKYINHSKPHKNLKWNILIRSDGTPDIIFTAIKNVDKGTELTWDYGTNYDG